MGAWIAVWRVGLHSFRSFHNAAPVHFLGVLQVISQPGVLRHHSLQFPAQSHDRVGLAVPMLSAFFEHLPEQFNAFKVKLVILQMHLLDAMFFCPHLRAFNRLSYATIPVP